MAQNDPFLPDPVDVAESANATFDGTEWQEVTQLADADGNATFSGAWHTQFNRVYVGTDRRRVRIENVSEESGFCAVEGDER